MRQFLTTLAAVIFLAAPAAQAENKSLGVHAKDFYAFATSEKQKNGAVFGTLKNVSREDAVITDISGDVAENIELHTTSTKLGIMKMREVDDLTVPKRQVVQLNPKGNHIMLMGLKRQLNVGDTLYLKISNADGIGISIPVSVRKAGDVPEGVDAAMQAMKDTAQKKPAPVVEKVVEDVTEEAAPEKEAPAEESTTEEEASSTPPAAVADPAAMEEKVEEATQETEETAIEAVESAQDSVTEAVKEEVPAADAAPAPEKPAKKSLWDKLKW